MTTNFSFCLQSWVIPYGIQKWLQTVLLSPLGQGPLKVRGTIW